MKDIKMNRSNTKFEHEFVADLVYFDGPLISLFKGSNGLFYLYCWSEADSSHHRWLIIELDASAVRGYISGSISLREVITAPPTGNLYLVDMNEEGRYDGVYSVDAKDLPQSFIPDPDSFYTSGEFDRLSSEEKTNLLTSVGSQLFVAMCQKWFPPAASLSTWLSLESHSITECFADYSSGLLERFQLTIPEEVVVNKEKPKETKTDGHSSVGLYWSAKDNHYEYALAA